VERLEGTLHQIIADRIEAGTFACAAAITGGDVILQDVHPDHMAALVDTMENMGTEFEIEGKDIRVVQKKQLKATDCTALPYPGLPTDMQPQLMAVLSVARGTSVVADSVYPERFTQVGELHRLGADIVRQGPQAVVRGPAKLTGAPVTARDLRGGASLVIAALAADGETAIEGVKHIDRGYESIANRLRAIGADIEREGEPPIHVGQLHLPFRQAAS
jgi:UDP-N-acetylglucosamine 1-carboxyvinyltransferase